MDFSSSEFQFLEEQSWINNFIKFKLGVDGISILFIVLTAFITPICVISCINSVKTRMKEFLIAILILETFMIGVFCSLDLVVFYLFFEAGFIHPAIWPLAPKTNLIFPPKRLADEKADLQGTIWSSFAPIA